MNRTFRLSLDVVTIFGYERFPFGNDGQLIHSVSDLVVAELVNGINAGKEFDPVILDRYSSDELAFRLSWVLDKYSPLSERGIPIYDGGHNRVIAHYIAGAPLLCRMRNENDREIIPIPNPPFKPISQYILLDDRLFESKGIGLKSRREKWQKH